MKKILVAIFVIMLAACSRSEKESQQWLWTTTTHRADSLSREIDIIHFRAAPRDSILAAIEELHAEAKRQKNPDLRRLLTARYHYMMARQARGDGDRSLALKHLEAVRQLTDSAAYPYEYHRYRTLAGSLRPENSKDAFIETLRDYTFYRTCGDAAMEASTAILVGHRLDDSKVPEKALAYYMLADSIYGRLGMKEARSKNKINIANQLGDDPRCDSLLAVLRADPYIAGDKSARNLVLRNSYLRTGDVEYLYEVYRMAAAGEEPLELKTLYEVMLNRYYAERNVNPDSADRYAAAAFANRDVLTNHNQKGLAYLGQAERVKRLGMTDSAYSLLRTYMAELDSSKLINQPTEIMRIQNVMELNRLEEGITRADFTHRLHILYICIAGLIIIVVLASILFVRERIHKDVIRKNMTKKLEAEKEMERSRRSLMAISLAREESENTLASIREKIDELKGLGKVSSEEAACINAVIRNHTIQRSDWEMFQEQFEKTSPDFLRNLRQRAPGITENQIRLATFIHIGMTNKQISSFMNIRPESIKQARWRLRIRLALPPEASLEEYLDTLTSADHHPD